MVPSARWLRTATTGPSFNILELMQSIRKYYRTYNESHEGTPGLFYCEVNNGMITRMINSFEHELWWATPSAHNNEQYDFTTHPEFPEAGIENLKRDAALTELSLAEFEDLWRRATRQV